MFLVFHNGKMTYPVSICLHHNQSQLLPSYTKNGPRLSRLLASSHCFTVHPSSPPLATSALVH